jgi:hypothetical protein
MPSRPKTAVLLAAALALPLAACAHSPPPIVSSHLATVEVFDRQDNVLLPVYLGGGERWIVGTPGHEYTIRIRNHTGQRILEVPSVDGVNAITGETALAQQSGYVLAPYRQFDISGWRKNLASTAAFYFTSLPDSYAARTGRPDNVGVIGVAFYRKREEPAPIAQSAPFAAGELSRKQAASGAMADAEPQGAPRDARREERLGTGHGRIETSHTRHVGFERATSEPAETVTIYYDSYRNLLARGIVPPLPYQHPPRRPAPNPFPGFAADPPA